MQKTSTRICNFITACACFLFIYSIWSPFSNALIFLVALLAAPLTALLIAQLAAPLTALLVAQLVVLPTILLISPPVLTVKISKTQLKLPH